MADGSASVDSVVEVAAAEPWRRPVRVALGLFIGAGVAGAGAFLLAAVLTSPPRPLLAIPFALATLLAASGFFAGIYALVRILRWPQPVPTRYSLGVALLPIMLGGVMSLLGALLTLFATVNFARGRQLRRLGRILLPRLRSGGGWAHLELGAEAEPALREGLAAQWRENGRTEHASVAAFARLTLDLMALGAPPELVHAANRDARDEIRHTELCFSLARALDGRAESPGPFPEAQRARTLPTLRTLALAQLAVDSLVDGALNEGVSARVIARLVKRCEEPAIRAVLKEIAADEGRHAAHGWDVVEWCLAEGGAPVAHALRGAVEALPLQLRSPLPPGAVDGSWERYGIHGHALEQEEYARARTDLLRRIQALTAQLDVRAA